MSVNAARSIAINLTGDVIMDKIYSATQNAASPGSVTIHTLTNANNEIVLPSVSGITVKAATIIPPPGNTATLILKGSATADIGLIISKTEPTSIAFDSPPPANFHINANATVLGVRIVWT